MAKINITLGAAALAAIVALPALAEEAAAPVPENVAAPVPENIVVTRADEDESESENEDSIFEASLKLDVMSAYVTHDRIFSDTPVAQYDVWLQANIPNDLGWLALDVWANQELNKRHSCVNHGDGGKRLGGLGEFDYELIYGNKIGPVEFTASHLWWTYPRCGWHAQKFWTIGAEYDNAILKPSVKLFWEYGHIHNADKPDDCFMIDFALSHKWDLYTGLSLTFTSKTTLYTENYAEYISDGAITEPCFGGWDNGLSLEYELTKNVTIGASLNYLYKIDHRVRHCPGWDSYSVGSGHDTHDGFLYGGFSVSVSF